jgi:hypothetical protein
MGTPDVFATKLHTDPRRPRLLSIEPSIDAGRAWRERPQRGELSRERLCLFRSGAPILACIATASTKDMQAALILLAERCEGKKCAHRRGVEACAEGKGFRTAIMIGRSTEAIQKWLNSSLPLPHPSSRSSAPNFARSSRARIEASASAASGRGSSARSSFPRLRLVVVTIAGLHAPGVAGRAWRELCGARS